MRYTAYSSDIGEAFRPVVPQWAVKATYGLAITYIAGEVGVATYKAVSYTHLTLPTIDPV